MLAQMLLVPWEQPAAQAPALSQNASHKNHEEKGDARCSRPSPVTRPVQKSCDTRTEDAAPCPRATPVWQERVLLTPNAARPSEGPRGTTVPTCMAGEPSLPLFQTEPEPMKSGQGGHPHLGDTHRTLLSSLGHSAFAPSAAGTQQSNHFINKKQTTYEVRPQRLHQLPGWPPSGGGMEIPHGKARASSKGDSGACRTPPGAGSPVSTPKPHHQPQRWRVLAEEVIIRRLV